MTHRPLSWPDRSARARFPRSEPQASGETVVFPDLAGVAKSAPYAQRALDYFRARGVPAIDLVAAYRDRTPESLCVGPRDSHPNEAVHADVADRTFAWLEREGFVR